ncbi:hypothetical protein ACHAPA_011439 [Fusarium lateritium]
MSVEGPSKWPSAALSLELHLNRLPYVSGWQDPIMQAVQKQLVTAFSDIKKQISANLADELAHSTLEKLKSMNLHVAQDITQCPTYQGLEKASASASARSISFPDLFFLAYLSSYWGLRFTVNKVSSPSASSHEEQATPFQEIDEKGCNPRSESPPGSPETPSSLFIRGFSSSEASSDHADDLTDVIDGNVLLGEENEKTIKCMQARLAELENQKSQCEMNKLVTECRDTMKSQAEQIAALTEENNTLRMDFANYQSLVNESVKFELEVRRASLDNEIAQTWSDTRKDGRNHEARDGGKRRCT